MKKMFLMFLFVICITNIIHAAAFGNNTIVVFRIGDGSGALASVGTAVFLDEYKTSDGSLVQTITIPTSGTPNYVNVGNSSAEGFMTLSGDGNYLVFCGYNAAVGTASATVLLNTTNRVIARVNQAGTVDFPTTLSGESVTTGNVRGVASTDGTNYWISTSITGVRYTTLAATTSTQLNTSAPTNLRAINNFNNQLYISSSSTTFLGVSSVGTGMPTTGSQTITALSGFPTTGTHSNYGFQMSPDGNTIYVVDDGSVANGGGIQKWTLSGGTWSLAYTLNVSPTGLGFRGIVVQWLSQPVIYSTSNEALNGIYTVTDAGSGSTVTKLVTAPTNTAFRGIAFTPGTTLPVELSSFTSTINGRNVQLNWETKTEVKFYKFEIDRALVSTTDAAVTWASIGTVQASGTTNSPRKYSYTEKDLQTGKYQYRLKMIDNDGSYKFSNIVETDITLPKDFELSQNYPNPFNPSTRINYSIPFDSRVTLEIFNVLGVRVGQLVNQEQSAGFYSVDFNSSSFSKGISSGVYLYKISAVDKVTGNSFSAIKKMILLK